MVCSGAIRGSPSALLGYLCLPWACAEFPASMMISVLVVNVVASVLESRRPKLKRVESTTAEAQPSGNRGRRKSLHLRLHRDRQTLAWPRRAASMPPLPRRTTVVCSYSMLVASQSQAWLPDGIELKRAHRQTGRLGEGADQEREDSLDAWAGGCACA
jgi:hypothetical protein